ncbi:glycosyltransferase family 39 protein [Methanosphaera sp.]|uniref:glycosyltransferase family 39 protein n=1 Tax=Methanosphaera sp. TaxID=2666342 RepID=UPI002E799F79|nr:glycosyltransferase family 39 protein [Methanosphaera sp.]MEE1117251.1 glycosyltransferase family 39 protein [Methanosphaera sp.]
MFGINDFSRNNKLLGILSVLMIIYTGILLYSQSIRSISYWDIFVYLQNAMLFSGNNIGSQLSVPPVLSLLTSVPFKLGFISETSLFVVSGILFIFLIIGMYLLFNERFDCEISLLASLIFSMLSLIVTWALTGATDVPALSFGVWALLFTIWGLNKDFKYYYPAFLFFILAFFTRFTEGFILIVMGYYLLINFEKFKKQLTVKNILPFVVYVLIIGLIICGVYLSFQGTIPFISQFLEVSSSSQVSSVNVGYELNPYYYLQNLPEYLTSFNASDSYFVSLSTSDNSPTPLSYAFILLVVIYLLKFLSKLVNYDICEVDNKNIKIAAIILLSIFTIISYTHLSYMITELVFIVILLLYYRWLPDKDNQMDYLMLLWIGIYIIMHSYHPVKVDRYIIPILIPLTYFVTTSIQFILKDKKKVLIALLIILILMIPVNASYLSSITHENQHTHEEKVAAEWLGQYDPNYKSYNISSDRGVVFSWYLKKYVYTTIPRVLEANNESLIDKLNSIEAKYYIDSTSNTTKIAGYQCIYDNNKDTRVKIYERK